MLYKGGTIDESAVKQANGQILEDGNGVRVGGWSISTHKGPITPDSEVEHIKEQLHTLAAPEQLYGDNHLKLTHEASGTTISFTALDALQGWLEDKSAVVQVGAAEEWMRSRQQEVQAHGVETLQYDWTYTTSYAGTVSSSNSSGTAGDAAPGADGTLSPAAAAAPRWEPTSSQISRALLTSRDPILYYDELPLYESELDDHGSSRISLKVRVMPRCWYVLLRFWLRVDHVLVRLRETRMFCQFDTPEAASLVLREVRYHEGTFAELRAAGAPAEGPAYADPDTASAALMAVAPVGVTHYRMEQLHL